MSRSAAKKAEREAGADIELLRGLTAAAGFCLDLPLQRTFPISGTVAKTLVTSSESMINTKPIFLPWIEKTHSH